MCPGCGWPPVQLTVMPWWVMFSVWLTVTCRFSKSLYMNDNGLVADAARAYAVRSESGAQVRWCRLVIG